MCIDDCETIQPRESLRRPLSSYGRSARANTTTGKAMRYRTTLVFLALTIAGVAVSVSYFGPTPPRQELHSSHVEADNYGNIHKEDYLGPEACASCHTGKYQDWQNHSHSKMNLNPSDTSVLGDFSGRKVEYGTGQVVFETKDNQFLMSLFENGECKRQYRVTRTVGSRIEQMYIGVQTKGPEPPGHPVFDLEGKLPFGYWIKRDRWFPDSYFDSDRAAEPTHPSAMSASLGEIHSSLQWRQTCIYCHNTYPYQHRVFFGEGLGFPASNIQVNGTPAMVRKWGPATPDNLVTLGVSCESCHFGGREHVHENRESRYYPSSPHLKIDRKKSSETLDSADDPFLINSICSQCHCAKITTYPNGGGTWNSREALDLTSSACSSQLKCTDCHDPHRSTQNGGMLSETRMVDTCIRCHQEFAAPIYLNQHTRHSSNSGVTCLDCHMPKIVQGLEEVVRSHHIDSPTQTRMLENAAPNACNLCHLDKSISWTLNQLELGWGCKIRPDERWEAQYQGSLNTAVGHVWLAHPQPVIRLVASAAYSNSPFGKTEMPRLLEVLKDPQAVNRMFGLFGVERVLGRQLTEDEYSPMSISDRRNTQVDKLIESWINSNASTDSKP